MLKSNFLKFINFPTTSSLYFSNVVIVRIYKNNLLTFFLLLLNLTIFTREYTSVTNMLGAWILGIEIL